MKKISVILPVYNVEKYVRKCLLSIVEQSYQNFEVLIVDDGSVDNFFKEIEDIVAENKNIKINSFGTAIQKLLIFLLLLEYN